VGWKPAEVGESRRNSASKRASQNRSEFALLGQRLADMLCRTSVMGCKTRNGLRFFKPDKTCSFQNSETSRQLFAMKKHFAVYWESSSWEIIFQAKIPPLTAAEDGAFCSARDREQSINSTGSSWAFFSK
jgi:hypothetical protein